MPNDKVATQIRLDETTHALVKAISVLELRSLNAQMEYFILKGIKDYENQNGKVTVPEDIFLSMNEI